MTKITFLGGVNEIGGNCFFVEDKDTKVLLDFGLRYKIRQKYFEEYLQPRTSCGLADVLTMGLIPDMPDFYRKDLLAMMGCECSPDPCLDGVLLSHIHYDHSANISFLDERVPVYSSEITELYAKVLIESGSRRFEKEVYDFKPRPSGGGEKIGRIFKTFQPYSEFDVGSIHVHSFPVDHSVAGASAYLLECSDMSLFFTGDFRLHGPLGYQTEKSLEKMAEHDPDLLLCEGTRIDDVEINSEKEVEESSLEIANGCKQLIIADFAARDIFRLSTFHQIAQKLDRKLLITKQDAYLIRELCKVDSLKKFIPSIDADSVLIYIDRKDSGTYDDRDYNVWEREFLTHQNAVRSKYIHENQDKVIACMSFFDINELIDIKPKEGSIYIESISEPHNEEQEVDVERLNNWLDFFGLAKYHIHASGHVNALDLKSVANTIKPKELIPIHTEKPELFKTIHDNVTIVEQGQTIST
ncbi:MBL fold metallo-hydrolase [Thermoproteota archaeon]